jgi:uncharacterized membrane protein YbhN (UPF0104 family)
MPPRMRGHPNKRIGKGGPAFDSLPRPMRKTLARIVPWVVTGAILWFLFSRIDKQKVLDAARDAPGWFVPVIAGIVLAIYLTDSFAIWKTFGWFVTPLRYREVLTLRGVTYLLALINYTLGQGAFAYFLNRTRGVAVMRAAAAVLLVMGINLLLLLILSTVGLALGNNQLPELKTLIIVAYVGLGIYAALLAWRPAFLTSRPILDVLLNAGIDGHLKSLAVRLPHVTALMVLNYVGLHAFGVPVPVFETLLVMPIVFLIATVPISFQGLGPSQGAMVYFFAPFATGTPAEKAARVLAASLAIQIIGWAVQITLGVICGRSQLGRSLRQSPKEISSAA